MIDYDKFQKSLKHLEEQYKNYLTLNNRLELSLLDKEGVTESVIQRFETCYDSLWKVLKHYLKEELGIPDMPNSPKPIFQIAFDNGIIDNILKWKEYANARTDTAHDYSGIKVNEALQLMPDFIENSIDLYKTMTYKKWE